MFVFSQLSRIDCNQFGIWSTKDEFLGAAVHPLASFLNHSCIPNVFAEWEGVKLLCRTLYPVPAGTELNLSCTLPLYDTTITYIRFLTF